MYIDASRAATGIDDVLQIITVRCIKGSLVCGSVK